MEFLDFLSDTTSIDKVYWILIFKSIIIWVILDIIKRIILKFVKVIKDNKKEYLFSQTVKLVINIIKSFFFLLIWAKYLSNLLTFITVLSGAFTIAVRDIIWNYILGIYIRVSKIFDIEDRIEVNGLKGDVINLNRFSFEILEINNDDKIGQSTGVVTHVPNSFIFTYQLKNYSKVNYIWDELTVNIPLNFDIEQAKSIIYRIVNTNDIIKDNPTHFKNDINSLSTNYRIYYNKAEPTIYVKVVGDYVEYTVRYLVHPKKARYVNSLIWKELLIAHQKKEIILYNKDYVYKEDLLTKLKKK